jgi:hypothetical protein
MSEPANTDGVPQPERWIYGGQRLTADNSKCHAWVPEGTDHELLFRHQSRHGWAIGAICQVTVSRNGERVSLHEAADARWVGRIDDLAERARLETLDMHARDVLASLAFERKAKADPALAEALAPLLAVAATLSTSAQLRALLGYVTEQVHRHRWAR